MLTYPTRSSEFKTSANLHHDKGVFVPKDDAPFFIVFPINPNWIPESLGPGWVVECLADAPGVLDVSLRGTVLRSHGDRRTAVQDENTHFTFQTTMDGWVEIPIVESFLARHIVVEGRSMADSPITIDIKLVNGEECGWGFPAVVKDYPPSAMLWRRFEQGHITTDDKTAIFRMRAEYCTDADLVLAMSAAKEFENRGCRIINHPRSFHIHNPKDSTFDAWDAAGVPHPVWEPFDSFDPVGQALRMAGRTGASLIRLNDMASGHGLKCVMAGDSNTAVQAAVAAISQEHFSRIITHSWCRIIVVEKIQPDNEQLFHFRTFVSNGVPFCTCVMLTKAKMDHCYAMHHAIPKIVLEAQLLAEDRHWRYFDLLSKACVSTGLDCGAVDWLAWPDREPVFLEVNGYWGMGAGLLWPYDNKLRQFLIENVEREPKKFPFMSLRLDEWEFWKTCYSMLGC